MFALAAQTIYVLCLLQPTAQCSNGLPRVGDQPLVKQPAVLQERCGRTSSSIPNSYSRVPGLKFGPWDRICWSSHWLFL